MVRVLSCIVTVAGLLGAAVPAAAATPTEGVTRNQVSLNLAGYQTPAIRGCARVGVSASAFSTQCGQTYVQRASELRGGSATLAITALAMAAAGAGIYAGVHEHNRRNVSP